MQRQNRCQFWSIFGFWYHSIRLSKAYPILVTKVSKYFTIRKYFENIFFLQRLFFCKITGLQWGKLRSSKNKCLVVTSFPGLRPNLARLKSDPLSVFWRQKKFRSGQFDDLWRHYIRSTTRSPGMFPSRMSFVAIIRPRCHITRYSVQNWKENMMLKSTFSHIIQVLG